MSLYESRSVTSKRFVAPRARVVSRGRDLLFSWRSVLHVRTGFSARGTRCRSIEFHRDFYRVLGCALDTFLDPVRHASGSIGARSSLGLRESRVVSLPRPWHCYRLGDSTRRCPVSINSGSEKRDWVSADAEESGMFYGSGRNADYA